MMMVDGRRGSPGGPPGAPDQPPDDDYPGPPDTRPAAGPWSSIWAPLLAGLVTAGGVFAGIASSMSSPNSGQVLLATVGSLLPGAFAAWQTREQLVEKNSRPEGRHGGPLALQELPPDVADFTGREDVVARLTDLLTPPVHGSRDVVPVVAVSGKGGIGKTALSLHVAHSRTLLGDSEEL